MKKHISYHKIGQFRNTIYDINRKITFVGRDSDNKPIFDDSISKPVLTFKGTVKLHGTNSSVCFNKQDGFWIQSRKNIITPEEDNAGFASFAESNKDAFLDLINSIKLKHQIDTNEYTISIYGEWAGKGIQKGVGIAQLEKSFYVFGVKISKPQDIEFNSYWVDSSSLRSVEHRIYNVEDFKTFTIDIDFNTPQLSQNKLKEITEEVERECPISKALGVEGIGEGVVWSTEYKGCVYKFKVKGDKHSSTKVKKLASVDVEKLHSIQEFIEYSVTENRFSQAIENVFGNGNRDAKKIGHLIRWVVQDITAEETDTMVENNLKPKDVNKYISAKVVKMFFNNL